MQSTLLKRTLVPLANEGDARTTCDGIERYLDEDIELHVVHVIEKAGGAPDKAPLKAREEQAKAIFDLVETRFEETEYEIATDLRYATSVVDEIIAAVDDHDATAIAFTPRPSGRITQLLTGNTTQKLVGSDCVPVIVLPREGDA
ncbi:universal stress protein [Natronoglomus mannanivorans]|uniref:Universal stress protein n=1 Tax=Natronoglomus mannanivorans TaxID=2979990 RepID=A0AAP2Z1X7_9EURY|nr:universal stress protein [Halobacteria archaeon AArc-xg1-1]